MRNPSRALLMLAGVLVMTSAAAAQPGAAEQAPALASQSGDEAEIRTVATGLIAAFQNTESTPEQPFPTGDTAAAGRGR